MNDNKEVTLPLPRLVYSKDDRADDYKVLTCHKNLKTDGFMSTLKEIKEEFVRWKGSGKALFPDCYGLYRCNDKGYFILRFRVAGLDQENRPFVLYEAVWYEIDKEKARDEHARRLASILAPTAWQEHDTAVLKPIDSTKIDVDLRSRIEGWLKNPTKLFIYPESPSSEWPDAIKPSERNKSDPPKLSHVSTNAGDSTKHSSFFGKICAVLLFFAVVSAAWLGFEKNRLEQSYNSLHRSYQRLFTENEEMKNQLNEPAQQLQREVDRLKDILKEIQSLADRI